jgi:glutaminase
MQVERIVELVDVDVPDEISVRSLVSPIDAYLKRLHERYAGLTDGQVATYIPELAKADPSWFGICLVTADGATYETGDTRVPFTIQSMSKPLTYGIVLEDHGEDVVRRRIGVEPTGDAFNSISLAPETGAPMNAMINAGAIASVSLVGAGPSGEPIDRILETYSRYAGRQLSIDQAVYESESETGHRNRAIGHLLRNAGVIEDDPGPVLERYFQQCAVLVDCRDLGMIAATLANGGVNPLTEERVADEQTVRGVLSVMTSCGMYDAAGEWLYSVGLPAKSGVAGGVLAVLPGRLGIGVFSPPLDGRGNSVRGINVCRDISRDLNLHLVQSGGRPAPPVRAAYNVAQIGSKRRRSERERASLAEVGSRAGIFELQGELSFPAAEAIARELVGASEGLQLAVLDLRRVSGVDSSAVPVLAHLIEGFVARGGQLALSAVQRQGELVEQLEAELGPTGAALVTFPELDIALEWCERQLLHAFGGDLDPARIRLREHELFRGLTTEQVVELGRRLPLHRFDAGSLVIRRGDAAEAMFLLTEGHLSVTLELPGGGTKRLATLSPGMVFGELAILSRGTRAADVWADTEVECYLLSADELARLGETDPGLKCTLLENLLRIVSRLARRMNDELALLSG